MSGKVVPLKTPRPQARSLPVHGVDYEFVTVREIKVVESSAGCMWVSCSAFSALQGGLNLNVHYHNRLFDGVFFVAERWITVTEPARPSRIPW